MPSFFLANFGGGEMEKAQTLDLNKGAECLLQGLIIIQFNREKAILATVPSGYSILFTGKNSLVWRMTRLFLEYLNEAPKSQYRHSFKQTYRLLKDSNGMHTFT